MNLFSIIVPLIPEWGEKSAIVLLYLGPDSMLPLASLLAAVAGFFLIFWRYILKTVKKFFRWILRKPAETSPVEPAASASVIGENEPKDQA